MFLQAWLDHLKARPSIGASILLLTTATGVLAWSVGTIDNLGKVLAVIGLDSTSQNERRKTFLNAYELGKNLATIVRYQRAKRESKEQPSEEYLQRYAQYAQSVKGHASLLGLPPIDVEALRFDDFTSDYFYETEPGFMYVSGLVTSAKSIEAATSFKAGFYQSISTWDVRQKPEKDLSASFDKTISERLDPAVRIGFPKFELPTLPSKNVSYRRRLEVGLDRYDEDVHRLLER
jgi:hypothetical protein